VHYHVGALLLRGPSEGPLHHEVALVAKPNDPTISTFAVTRMGQVLVAQETLEIVFRVQPNAPVIGGYARLAYRTKVSIRNDAEILGTRKTVGPAPHLAGSRFWKVAMNWGSVRLR